MQTKLAHYLEIQKTRVNDHTTFFDFVLGHIWFLVIILGHIWFVWILGSHTRTIYDFLEIIQGSYKNISRTKNCIILIFYWSWKNFFEIIQCHMWHIWPCMIGWLVPQIDWCHKFPYNRVRGLIKLLYRICKPHLILCVRLKNNFAV